MARYKSIVITNAGLALAAAAHSGDTIHFTAMKSGKGTYNGTEVLEEMTDLKNVQQTFGITGITREAAVVKVRSALTNEGVTDGYHLTEMGLYALDPSTSNEILYAIIVSENDMADYFPPYTEAPQSVTLEAYITATGIDEGVTFTASIVAGTYVTVQDFEDFRVEVNNKVNKEEGKGLSTNDYTDSDKETLSDLSEDMADIKTKVNNKVDKVSGKGLSTNDYTTEEKEKLAGIAEGANKYTHPAYTAKSSGLYKIAVDNTGHVSSVTEVAKSDITALGIPASDTDTHYTSKNVVNKNTTSTSNTTTALTNGNVYLISVENGAVTSAHKISGSGATKVTTDTSGNIVISSTDTDTVYTHPESGATAGTYRSVTVDANGHVTAGTNPTIAITQGGTGATSAAAARTNLGIGNVNNTSDANKPVSTAQQTAIDDALAAAKTYTDDEIDTINGKMGKIQICGISSVGRNISATEELSGLTITFSPIEGATAYVAVPYNFLWYLPNSVGISGNTLTFGAMSTSDSRHNGSVSFKLIGYKVL